MHLHFTFVGTRKNLNPSAMKESKAAVINYLKHDRTLLGARNLYNHLANKNLAFQRQMARWTDNPLNVERACYELAKAVGLEERLLKICTQKPVELPAKPQAVVESAPPQDLTPEEKLLAFDPETILYNDARALVKELELTTDGKKKEAVYGALEAAKKTLVTRQVSELPEEVKASIKLREQFPFLRDPQCPDSLKLLVSELITSFENFKGNQPKLHENLSDVDAQALVDVILQDYIDNKQAWDELEHFKTTGKVLGLHPIFELIKGKEELSAMKTEDLAKKIKNLENNIARNRNKGNLELLTKQEALLAHAKTVLAAR